MAYGSSIRAACWSTCWSKERPAYVPGRGGPGAAGPGRHIPTCCTDMHALLQRGAPYARFYHGIRLVHTGRIQGQVLVPRSARIRPWSGGSRGGVGRGPHRSASACRTKRRRRRARAAACRWRAMCRRRAATACASTLRATRRSRASKRESARMKGQQKVS